MYTPSTQKKSAPICGVNCFRYLPKNEGQTQQNYVCYVGSSEGATIRLRDSCIWSDILTGPIDQSAPRTSAESALSRASVDCASGPVILPTPSDEAAIAHHNARRLPKCKGRQINVFGAEFSGRAFR